MSINHHLDDATIFSYVAGALPQGMALVVACHLSMCDTCRSRLRAPEAVGGALLESLSPDRINDDALEQVLDRLDEPDSTSVSSAAEVMPVQSSEVPQPLASLIGNSLDDLEWKRMVPGICYIDLPSGPQGVTKLLRVAPGGVVLPHTHRGNELTLLLRGSLSDEIGRFQRGDVSDLDDQVEHQPLADSREGCICLVATDAPIRFTTLLGRLVQPLTGF
ncbi:ChrR family anti-sigma-E factor [Neptuniibacter sp. CAU 1671]|uniref:ChrR family anti-sigma-E factor n=1 Tax=Neptuniibacter sp. CAU 1671 TaxID=3032593 RepID=UPI0023D993C3|nr:ChrR family anti-sigma-E factor [Neptuniibacter sp. CAU 1671]MDF2182798.1 ChrR family anti-sigma-E factor [Neptuniibacter sp. CAU 1671]